MMPTFSREAALFYRHRSVLIYTGLFREKISKNRLICKFAVALACDYWYIGVSLVNTMVIDRSRV